MKSDNKENSAVVWFEAVGALILIATYLVTQLLPVLGVGATMFIYLVSKEKLETTSFLEFLGVVGIAVIINLVVFTIATSLS